MAVCRVRKCDRTAIPRVIEMTKYGKCLPKRKHHLPRAMLDSGLALYDPGVKYPDASRLAQSPGGFKRETGGAISFSFNHLHVHRLYCSSPTPFLSSASTVSYTSPAAFGRRFREVTRRRKSPSQPGPESNQTPFSLAKPKTFSITSIKLNSAVICKAWHARAR